MTSVTSQILRQNLDCAHNLLLMLLAWLERQDFLLASAISLPSRFVLVHICFNLWRFSFKSLWNFSMHISLLITYQTQVWLCRRYYIHMKKIFLIAPLILWFYLVPSWHKFNLLVVNNDTRERNKLM